MTPAVPHLSSVDGPTLVTGLWAPWATPPTGAAADLAAAVLAFALIEAADRLDEESLAAA